MKRLAGACLVLLLWLAPAAWAADDLEIADFVGHFAGAGVANSKDAVNLGFTIRDLGVVVEKTEDGFSVVWTTVIRGESGPDGAKPEVRRTSSEARFVRGDNPRFFRSVTRNDPTGAGGYAWASLEGRTLTIYLLVINPENGNYDLHSYARTMVDDRQMELKFSRISSGRPRVIVEGDLTRQ